MYKLGGVGCIHRFNSIEEQSNIVEELYTRIFSPDLSKIVWEVGCGFPPIMAAIGVSEGDKERAKSLVDSGCNIILIDVCHGHHENVRKMIEWCRENLDEEVDIIWR